VVLRGTGQAGGAAPSAPAVSKAYALGSAPPAWPLGGRGVRRAVVGRRSVPLRLRGRASSSLRGSLRQLGNRGHSRRCSVLVLPHGHTSEKKPRPSPPTLHSTGNLSVPHGGSNVVVESRARGGAVFALPGRFARVSGWGCEPSGLCYDRPPSCPFAGDYCPTVPKLMGARPTRRRRTPLLRGLAKQPLGALGSVLPERSVAAFVAVVSGVPAASLTQSRNPRTPKLTHYPHAPPPAKNTRAGGGAPGPSSC